MVEQKLCVQCAHYRAGDVIGAHYCEHPLLINMVTGDIPFMSCSVMRSATHTNAARCGREGWLFEPLTPKTTQPQLLTESSPDFGSTGGSLRSNYCLHEYIAQGGDMWKCRLCGRDEDFR